MSITINHEDVGTTEFKILPKGEYEVFPIDFTSSVSQAGNDMVTFTYAIRDDVDQLGKGKELRFDRFVATPKAAWRINAASKAAHLEHGVEYETLEEWAGAFNQKAVRVVVDHEEGTNGKTYPTVKAFKSSEVGGEYTDTSTNNNNNVQINEDDLPF